jgi:hypothetical protein
MADQQPLNSHVHIRQAASNRHALFALTLRPLRLCGEVQRSNLVPLALYRKGRKGRKVKAKSAGRP